MIIGTTLSPGLFLLEVLTAFAAIAIAASLLIGFQPTKRNLKKSPQRKKKFALVEAEKDVATNLNIPFRTWVILRAGAAVIALLLGIWIGIPILIVFFLIAAILGFRWMLGGRAVKLGLERDRRFIELLHNLEQRISVGNQPLDRALQDLGRQPPKGLETMLYPIGRGGSIVQSLAEVGERSRSPLIKHSIGLLIFARSRSIDNLLKALEDVVIPNASRQLEIQEEALTKLTKQRAVSIVMILIISVMFIMVQQSDTYNLFYHSLAGQIVLIGIVIFLMLAIWSIGLILRGDPTTEWNMEEITKLEEKLNG